MHHLYRERIMCSLNQELPNNPPTGNKLPKWDSDHLTHTNLLLLSQKMGRKGGNTVYWTRDSQQHVPATTRPPALTSATNPLCLCPANGQHLSVTLALVLCSLETVKNSNSWQELLMETASHMWLKKPFTTGIQTQFPLSSPALLVCN